MITDNWLDVAAVGNSVLCQGGKPWSADASNTENSLGDHRVTCKEHADCLYSRHMECLSSPRRTRFTVKGSGCPSRHLQRACGLERASSRVIPPNPTRSAPSHLCSHLDDKDASVLPSSVRK